MQIQFFEQELTEKTEPEVELCYLRFLLFKLFAIVFQRFC
jgi:hypothetical protein